MNAAEAVLPEELVEVVEGVGSGHFVQALHSAQLRGGLQQLPRPRRFVPRAAPHLQGLAAAEPGRLVEPADKKRVLELLWQNLTCGLSQLSLSLRRWSRNEELLEYPKFEGTHKDHRVQLLAPQDHPKIRPYVRQHCWDAS